MLHLLSSEKLVWIQDPLYTISELSLNRPLRNESVGETFSRRVGLVLPRNVTESPTTTSLGSRTPLWLASFQLLTAWSHWLNNGNPCTNLMNRSSGGRSVGSSFVSTLLLIDPLTLRSSAIPRIDSTCPDSVASTPRLRTAPTLSSWPVPRIPTDLGYARCTRASLLCFWYTDVSKRSRESQRSASMPVSNSAVFSGFRLGFPSA